MHMKKLSKGDPVPNFEGTDLRGNRVRLSDFEGQKLMISFYRHAECLFCDLRLHELLEQYDELNSPGLRFVAVFQSPLEEALANEELLQVPFAVIPDPEHILYKQFGVTRGSLLGYIIGALKLNRVFKAFSNSYYIRSGSGNRFLYPADFLINEDHTIHTAYYANNIASHLSLKAVRMFTRKYKKV